MHRPDAPPRNLSTADLEAILRVTRSLAQPFDLPTMLGAVVDAAKQVLNAERGSVWLYDTPADELVLEIGTGLAPVRVPADSGLVGACARSRAVINVPDCYADPRFDPAVDRTSGYRTRCMLTLPMVDHRDALVGVMQVLNKTDGTFDDYDERLATALAAQCAVALQRVRMTEALIDGERMRRSLEMAREVQMSTLPARMPEVPGYEVAGAFEPAELTGGDTYDFAPVGGRLLVVLADATGHGIAPALSVTQMHAMLRMAFRLGADLETAYAQLNDRLAETLADDRFITAFIGLVDPVAHTLTFLSGGQGPIFHYRAAAGEFDLHKPTSFPLGAMPLPAPCRAVSVALAPGDLLVVLSDGIYEYEDPRGMAFGDERVRSIVRAHRHEPVADLLDRIYAAVREHAAGASQADDMTGVLVRREPERFATRRFPRAYDSIAAMAAYTADFVAAQGVDPALLPTVDLAIEELFTNMVKYSPSSAPDVRIDLVAAGGALEVVLVDSDVDLFDPTQAPEVDVMQPIERRRPGGLGLHLVRKLVDDYRYGYAKRTRRSTIAFRVCRPPTRGEANPGG